MDSFAGKEARFFISFCSDTELSGQPTQQTAEEEMGTTANTVAEPTQTTAPEIRPPLLLTTNSKLRHRVH